VSVVEAILEGDEIRPRETHPTAHVGGGDPEAGAGQRSQYKRVLPFNQSDVSCPRPLLGFLDCEVDALAFS
jgi:hypothetical protein